MWTEVNAEALRSARSSMMYSGVVSRKMHMSTLIEIACFLVKEEAVQAIVAEYCHQTGDQLIGRSVYEQTEEVLLVLQFLHPGNVNKFAAVLSHALRLESISSFQYMTCNLVIISSDASLDMRQQMRAFPLCPGESWFPALHDPHQVYLCTSNPVLSPKQTTWLLEHLMAWAFV